VRARYGALVHVAIVERGAHPRIDDENPAENLIDAANEAHAKYGVDRGACYLVRPDGYVAFRGTRDDGAALLADLARRFGI